MGNKIKIYVASFYYEGNSNGIRMTYELVFMLNQLGYEAYNIIDNVYHPEWIIPGKYKKQIIFIGSGKPKLTDGIVIYPEQFEDNPYDSPQVVRLLLNRPYYIFHHGISYGETDYLCAYSYLVDNALPQLFIMIDERSLFTKLRNQNVTKRGKISIYFGKTNCEKIQIKVLRKILKNYDDINVITRKYPDSREKALKSLLGSELLICYDPLTNFSYESLLIGIPVILMDDNYHTLEQNYNVKQTGYFRTYEEYLLKKDFALDTYNYYSEYIDKQIDIIKYQMVQIQKHFINITTDSVYKEKIRVRNENQKNVDMQRYKEYLGNKTFYMIYTYNDIPVAVQKILKLHCYTLISMMKQQKYYKTIKTWKVFPLFKRIYNTIRK